MSQQEQQNTSDIVSSIPVNENQVIVKGNTGEQILNGKPVKEFDIKTIWTAKEHCKEAFKKQGFSLDEINDKLGVNIHENRAANIFFSRLDASKPLVITIESMSRIKAPEYYEEQGVQKYRVKEFLTWNLRLNGSDFVGEQIQCWLEHEGRCEEPLRTVKITEDKYGKKDYRYVFARETRHKYYVPFSKKAVDSLLEQTGNDKDDIIYYVKFGEYPNSKTMKSRNNLFDYNQFVNSSWDELVSLDLRPGGPTGHSHFNHMNPNNKLVTTLQ